MKLEHFSLNVESPLSMAAWYVENLELRIVKQLNEAPFTTFLVDDSGRIMIEICKNPMVSAPDYKKMDSLFLHFAFVSEDTELDKSRLIAAGATLESEKVLEDGSELVMLRDPWGIPIQLCKRVIKMLEAEPATF